MTVREKMRKFLGKFLCSIGLHWCKYQKNYAEVNDDQLAQIKKMPILIREQIVQGIGGHIIRICTRCGCVQRSVIDTSGCLSITDPPSYYWETIARLDV